MNNQNQYIEEEQTTQWPKEKVQRDKQRSKNIHIQCSLVKPPPSVQSVVWRYNEFDDKLGDIENRKLCDHMLTNS